LKKNTILPQIRFKLINNNIISHSNKGLKMNKILIIVALVSLLTSASQSSSIGVCKGCHGQDFSNSVKGKSKIVKNMNRQDIVSALKGYQAGTYGSVMKSVMESQVKALSSSDIEELADLIKQ
jgi:cytochrome c